MLLIDADNVSADVIDQAIDMILVEHGAIHVRRAYCTAESALANLKLFTTHSIRPIVNLSTGKNSTDIALAVDAMDLVVAERPDVAIIVSSDSDFAPLVIRLREKGCRVEGIGQLGKTGEDSKPVYDHFFDIAHRKSRSAAVKAPAKRAARGRTRAASAEPVADPHDDVDTAIAAAAVPASSAARAAPAAAAPRRARSPRTARAGRGAAVAESVDGTAASGAPAQRESAAPPAAPAPPPVSRPPAKPPMPDDLRRILAVLPELVRGGKMDLGLAAERLRSENLLSRSGPSSRLFKKYPDWFLLTPEQQPNKVEYRGLGAA